MKKIKAKLLSVFTLAFMFVNTINYSYANYDEYDYDDYYTQYEDSWGK